MKGINRIRDKINKTIEIISVSLLTVMVVAITFQVILRTAFEISITWLEPLTVFLFIWVSFFGIAYGFRERTHISVEVFYSYFPERIKRLCRRGDAILVVLVGAVIAYYGTVFALDSMGTNQPGLNIPSGFVYLVLPITGLLMIFFGLMNFINDDDSSGDDTLEETRGE
ncbi:TRAP transporter small permease [Alteribacillus sp. HJP-4]|uniref:TRAP transporter small permease n=1 Tax=Alteribacillus sp. HJP-4 TaxID=2775394 RepID=UPI0035CD0978